uniref:G_PROTEIN_RECEP_F1_2 domain-containing protein n=1 Tax=Heterorhabditis bacteriophora TaxID=37862 RepID=A0A1I7XUS4_HETBA
MISQPVKVIEFEPEKKACYGRLSYRSASMIVVVLEVLYWFYYLLLLIFACVNHQRAWSIIFTSVNLILLAVQVVIIWIGVRNEKPKLLQTHLIFLCLTLFWDLAVSIGFFSLAVLPYAISNKYVQYRGQEYNARTFSVIMGSLMLLWFITRFITTVIIYRYWKILRARKLRAQLVPYIPVNSNV